MAAMTGIATASVRGNLQLGGEGQRHARVVPGEGDEGRRRQGVKGLEREKSVAERISRDYAMSKPGPASSRKRGEMLEMGFAGAPAAAIVKAIQEDSGSRAQAQMPHPPSSTSSLVEAGEVTDLGVFPLRPEEGQYAGHPSTSERWSVRRRRTTGAGRAPRSPRLTIATGS